ncbi:unnamed protein product [Closterium sp. NIES-53]
MAVVLPVGSNENLPPKVVRVIVKELRSLQDSPPEGIRVLLNDDNISTVHAEIEGPEFIFCRFVTSPPVGTPYEGGAFRMKLVLGPEFPNAPPKGFFVTRIFHPNVAKNGEICVNILKKDWKPCLGLRHVVRCLLIEPYPESALNEDAGKLLLEDYEAYAKHARLFTSIHAPSSAAAAAAGVSMSRSKSMPQHAASQPGQQSQPGQHPSCPHHTLRQSVSASDHLAPGAASAAAAAAAAAVAEMAGSAAAAAAVSVSPSALAAGGAGGGSAPLAPNRSIANAEVQRDEGVGVAAGGSTGGLRSAGTGIAKITTAATPSLSHHYSTLRQSCPRRSPASLPSASPGLSARARHAPSPTTARRAALPFLAAACCRSTRFSAVTITEERIACDYNEVEKQTQLLRILESENERDRRTQLPPVERASPQSISSTAPPRQSREAVCPVTPPQARWLSPALAAAVVACVLLPLPLPLPPQHTPPAMEQGRAASSRSLGSAWGSAWGRSWNSAQAMPAPFSGASAPLSSETFDNVPQSLSGGLSGAPVALRWALRCPSRSQVRLRCPSRSQVGSQVPQSLSGTPPGGPVTLRVSLFVLSLLVSSLLATLDSSTLGLDVADAAAVPNPNTETKFRRIQFSQAELNAAATLRAAQRPQAPRRGGGMVQLAQRERTEAPTELRIPLNGAAMSVASLSEMLLVRRRGAAQSQPAAAAAAKQSFAESDGYAPCPKFQPWKDALSRISACKWRRPDSAFPPSASSPSVALRLFMIDFLEDKRGRAVENECRDRRWIWPRPLVTGGEVCVDEEDELQVDGDDSNDDDNNEEELPELVGAAELMERVRAALGQRRGEQRSRLEANEADEVGEVGALGGGGVLRFDDVFVNSKGTVFNESHVFAVDACGRGQWNRQGGAVKALKDSISFAPGTRVSVHEHLVNLLPYEQEEAEQLAEEAEEAEMAERGLRGTDWVAQARLHNGKERLLARLLPALYLVATALMPAARQYPLLLRSEHLLEHLGRSMFGVDLASLSVHHLPASRQHHEGHRHLFYAKTLFMPVHASSVCGLSSSGRPRAPDALWLALRGHHLLPPDGLPILSPAWTPRLPAFAQATSPPQSAPPALHPLHYLAVGRTLPEDWVVVVSLVWSAHVMDRGGGGVGDGNMRTAATRHTEEAMEAIAGMLRELYSEERVVVYEEHLPLRKAKALFSRTILLVGPTSPALSNLIFMPFNSTVIEILPYVVNGTLESSKSKVEDLQRDGKSGGKLSSQQSTATWHYRLSERVGVHHLLSVCDPERNHMDESEMCHVDEVYATVTASLRKNPVLREATGLPPVTFPPDDVSRLGDFRDFIPGTRLRKGVGQVAGFRQWAECVAEKGEWRFNATPRVLAWLDHGVEKCDAEWEAAGGIASTKADKIAAHGPAAAADWKVRDTLKYEWVVPTNKCPKVTGFGAAQLAVPSSEVLNPQELFSRFDGRGLCELARRRKGGLRVAFLGDSLSRESHVNFVNNIVKHIPKPANVITRRKCMTWTTILGSKVDLTCMEYTFEGAGCPESAEPGSTGGRRRNGRRKQAQHGEQAELRDQWDQRDGDQREGDAQDPRGERERTGAAAALEAAVEGSSLAVLPLADLIRAPRSAQQLEWQRAQQQQQQQAGGRAAAATASRGVCPDFQHTGGRRRNGRRKQAQHGEQAELRDQWDQRDGDQREGDAQDPRGERERTGAAAALEAAVEGSSLAVLPLADLIRAPRSAQQLEWQRAQQQQQQQAGGRAAAATASRGVCPDFQQWGFFSPNAPSPHIHACAWRPMAADDTPTAALPVSQSSKSSESSKGSAVLAGLSAFMQQFQADRASGGGGAVGGAGSRAGGSGAPVGGRSVAVQQDCEHWKWLWPRPLVTRGEMCLDEDEVREFVEEWLLGRRVLKKG